MLHNSPLAVAIRTLKWKRTDLADRLGCCRPSVCYWCSGKRKAPQYAIAYAQLACALEEAKAENARLAAELAEINGKLESVRSLFG